MDNPIQKLYAERASLYERLFVDALGWGKQLQAFFARSNYLHPNIKILDAGCGTGVVTRVLYQLAHEKGYAGITFHAFDLTPNMLQILRQWIAAQQATNIELRQADVLALETLPSHWREYDLIVSATMLEYLPKDQIIPALLNLRRLLRNGGILLVFITRRNLLTRWLAEKFWKTNLYTDSEMQAIFQKVGFDQIELQDFSPGWSSSIIVIEGKQYE